MTKLEVGKEYWIKQKFLEFVNDWNSRPSKKEPLYWVRDNKGKAILYKDVEAGGKVIRSGCSNVSYQEGHSVKYTFTEQEIKAYDERFWAFAVPVEELENE